MHNLQIAFYSAASSSSAWVVAYVTLTFFLPFLTFLAFCLAVAVVVVVVGF